MWYAQIMSFSKPKKPDPVAAAPTESALDIKSAQDEMQDDLRRRRGASQSTFAGETGLSSALG